MLHFVPYTDTNQSLNLKDFTNCDYEDCLVGNGSGDGGSTTSRRGNPTEQLQPSIPKGFVYRFVLQQIPTMFEKNDGKFRRPQFVLHFVPYTDSNQTLNRKDFINCDDEEDCLVGNGSGDESGDGSGDGDVTDMGQGHRSLD